MTGLHAEYLMKSNSLTLLGNVSQATISSLIPRFCDLAKAAKKKAALLACCDEAMAKNVAAKAQDLAKCEVVSKANAKKQFAALADAGTFVLVLGQTGEANLAEDAALAAELGSPALLLCEGLTDYTAIKNGLAQAQTCLAQAGCYPFATMLFGVCLAKSEENALNANFMVNGESPVFFFEDSNVTADRFAHAVDLANLQSRLLDSADLPMAPELFQLELNSKARKAKQRIVLAEGLEDRILKATDVLLKGEIADIVLLGKADEIQKKAKALGLDIAKATVIDPVNSDKFADYANTYYELRKKKGVTEEDAKKTMLDATVYGTMMVKKGDADGMVSGAVNTTAHTIRPALQFIKTKPGFSVVSSCFLMCLKDRVLVFGDCAVNPNPTAEQLAEIAVTTAQTAMAFGIEPRVAMISYSSGNSGKGPDVDLVIEATKLAKEKDPSLLIDGPLQYDAAIDPVVAKTKMPNSPVAGQATVFIFPSLTTGNTAYKAVQRACDCIAIGPVLQGLNKPVNDLSRGCLVPDIVNTVAITAIQAASEK